VCENLHLRQTSVGEGNHGVRRAEVDSNGVHECFRK
jgi:hypothetical protein